MERDKHTPAQVIHTSGDIVSSSVLERAEECVRPQTKVRQGDPSQTCPKTDNDSILKASTF
jgi:hypothetical protein